MVTSIYSVFMGHCVGRESHPPPACRLPW